MAILYDYNQALVPTSYNSFVVFFHRFSSHSCLLLDQMLRHPFQTSSLSPLRYPRGIPINTISNTFEIDIQQIESGEFVFSPLQKGKLTQAPKCPPFSLSPTNTTVPIPASQPFGKLASSRGKYLNPNGCGTQF
jgi:hypothetical protein